MKKETYVSMRLDEEEKARLTVLAGDQTITSFLLALAFRVKRAHGREDEYPGWEVVERGRRDGGIKISHPKHDPVMLYPEDDAYGSFED